MHSLTALILRVVAVAAWRAVYVKRLGIDSMDAAARACTELQLAADACEML